MPNIVVKEGSRPPWVGLAAAVWVLIAAGNGYNFPLYSPSLKSVLGFNQQQITILGVANDIGESVGLLPGIACNKFPPWALLSVGVVFCFLGYGVLWLAITQSVSGLPYWVVSDHLFPFSSCLVAFKWICRLEFFFSTLHKTYNLDCLGFRA
jgi:hypothetical protein